jgi:hypothetical protein
MRAICSLLVKANSARPPSGPLPPRNCKRDPAVNVVPAGMSDPVMSKSSSPNMHVRRTSSARRWLGSAANSATTLRIVTLSTAFIGTHPRRNRRLGESH